MRKFTKILVTMLIILSMMACNSSHERKVYHQKGSKDYVYQDDNLLWHYFIYNQLTGTYAESTSTSAPSDLGTYSYSYESTEASSNESGMSESTGESVGGSESSSESSSSDSDSGGMSESSGSDAGGSDSGGDSGGGDGGGGE